MEATLAHRSYRWWNRLDRCHRVFIIIGSITSIALAIILFSVFSGGSQSNFFAQSSYYKEGFFCGQWAFSTDDGLNDACKIDLHKQGNQVAALATCDADYITVKDINVGDHKNQYLQGCSDGVNAAVAAQQ
jgi:hypothetical protein